MDYIQTAQKSVTRFFQYQALVVSTQRYWAMCNLTAWFQPVVIRSVLAYLNALLTKSRRPLTWRVSDVFVTGVLAQPLVDAVSCPTSKSRTNDFFAYWNRKAHPLMYRLASSGNWWLPSRSSWDTCVYVEVVNLQRTLGQQTLHSYNLHLQAKATANPDSKGQVKHKGTEWRSFTPLPSN